MKITVRYLVSLYLIIIFWSSLIAAQPAELDSLIRKGKDQIYHFQLDQALEIFRQVQLEFPDLPHGYFYESYITAIYYSQDRTNIELDSMLQNTIRIAVEKGEIYKQLTGKNPEAMYYLGISNGVLGIYHVLNSNYFKGYIHGRRAKNFLEAVVRTDSTYYDAYLGLGIYHYYVDLLPGIIKIFAGMLGFHGNRDQGRKEILQTSRYGKHFKVEADFTYATMRYFLEGDYTSSLYNFQKLQKNYPQNPALSLMIGYHYRRFGQIKKALEYFESIPPAFAKKLPQIIVMKYYNLGVCYYRMNDFTRSEYYFNLMLDTTLRKSQYYQASLAFYKGLLAGLREDQKMADFYFNKISKNTETQYWYYVSRFYTVAPFDTLMRHYILAENNLYTFNRNDAAVHIEILGGTLLHHETNIQNPYLKFLIRDVQAKYYFQQGRVQQSKELYESFIDNMGGWKDNFQKAWIYISYARVLRELKNWEASQKMLDKASVTDDEYTRLIIQREKYILKNASGNFKT